MEIEGLVDLSAGAVPTDLEGLVRFLLISLGQNPEHDGLRDTPGRVARSLSFLTQGYALSPQEIVGEALFAGPSDEMVVVRDIELYSLCEHHLLPFFGRCHVAYIPDGQIIGLSKVARLVDMFARRLQVQERLTTEVADAIDELVKPRGVGVVVEARHFCMMMRGVEKQNSFAMTSCMRGSFRDNPETRAEFLELVRGGRF